MKGQRQGKGLSGCGANGAGGTAVEEGPTTLVPTHNSPPAADMEACNDRSTGSRGHSDS